MSRRGISVAKYVPREGWRLHDSNFETPEEALLAAMDDPTAPFLIVKKIVFKEAADDPR